MLTDTPYRIFWHSGHLTKRSPTAPTHLISIRTNHLGQSFITELTKYIQFQSTLEALIDPHDTSIYEPVNILAGLRNISDTDFASHYDFDLAISTLIRSAYDSHITFQLYSQQILNFALPVQSFMSASDNGYDSLVVYLKTELNSQDGGQTTSSISTVNGKDAQDVLDQFAPNLKART
ncbi:hypothetical protein ACHAP5_012278 [Fusarium lateritium]